MKSQLEIERQLKVLKPFIHNNFNVDKIGVFGSYSRNQHHKDSDIDILVSFSKPLGWEFFDLKDYLENKLNIKVDLVSEKALKTQLKDQILKSVKYV